MVSLRIIFYDGSFVRVFVRKPELFESQAIDSCSSVECVEPDETNIPEGSKPEECTITLIDGTRLTCSMLRTEMDSAAKVVTAIIDCERTYNTEILELATREEVIDMKLKSVAAIINNVPDKAFRLKLHRKYLSLKLSYAMDMEAMVETFINE